VTLSVVKVGGSFADAAELTTVVAALGRGAGRTVIVPGGGRYADLVRAEQDAAGFDDATAHRMALLAMAAFGYALAGRSPLLAPAPSIRAARAALARGDVPIWLPLDLLAGRKDIPESWEMTSDSLAAWLAGRLSAERIFYLKRVRPPGEVTAAELADAGILDPLAPAFLARANLQAWLCGPADLAALGRALAADRGVGRVIRLA
jgi:dihydroneopterin aldolase